MSRLFSILCSCLLRSNIEVLVLFRIMAIVRNILVSIIRDPLRLCFFVSAPAGALSSFLCVLHRFSDKCLSRRMAWPSSRPRDSPARIICAGPSFLKATMPKSFDFGLSKVVPAKRETLLGYALSAPVRARVSRVRAGVLSVSALEQGFPATKCEGPEDKAFLCAFCDINAPICVFFCSW